MWFNCRLNITTIRRFSATENNQQWRLLFFTRADIMALFGVKWLKRPIIMPNRSLIPHFDHLPAYTYDQTICQVRSGSRSSRPPLNRSKNLTLKCFFRISKINNPHMHASGIPWIYFLALSTQLILNVLWILNKLAFPFP